LAQHSQVLVVRVTQVKPDGDPLISEVVTDLANRETLKLKPAIPVKPRACLAPGRADIADSGCGHRVRITAVEGLGHKGPGTQHAAGRASWNERPLRISPVAHDPRVPRGVRAVRRAGQRGVHRGLLASAADPWIRG